MADCKSCKNYDRPTICSTCENDSDFEEIVMTNADHIRAMTNEELAEFLCDISKCESGYCPAYDTCMRTEHGTMKKWLQSEAE